MNKISIIIGIIVLVAIGWFLFQGSSTDYVAQVNDELTELEAELADIDAAVLAGTLSPEAAAEAQIKIVNRLDAINAAASAGQRGQLTDAGRVQLANSLERLKQALIRYQTTLTAVDRTVLELPEADRPKLNRRGGSSNRTGVAAVATETIETVEEQIEDIIADISDEDLAEELADSDDDGLLEDDMSTSTEEMPVVTGTTSVETEKTSDTSDDRADTSEETTEEMTEEEEATTSVELDSEIEQDTTVN